MFAFLIALAITGLLTYGLSHLIFKSMNPKPNIATFVIVSMLVFTGLYVFIGTGIYLSIR